MAKTLIIVESPTKAKTISKFLGAGYEVRASFGHVRDLPNNASEIPAAVKKEAWSRLGINVNADFDPLYIIPDSKREKVNDLKKLLKDCSELLLATDEDREGESISWHLLEVLKPKVPVKRLVFHEITKNAIDAALNATRDIDENLVKAQETRRIIDRLYGYSVSPLLWRKMAPRLSAGRVQSIAQRLLVERERERMSFKTASYWDIKAIFGKKAPPADFEAELTQVAGKRVASGRDFDPKTGKLLEPGAVTHLREPEARALVEWLNKTVATVLSVEEKPYTTKPAAPFTTSTLQQDASRKLGFAARRTMQVAQTLYENGFITYMRTDSTTLSDEALLAARTLITREFGEQFLFPEPRIYKTKVKNAQEAHEAIRPAGTEFASPAAVRERLGFEAFRLYEVIWKRTIASQMKDSVGTRIVAQIGCGDANFRASGSTISFPGFLRVYVEGSDDPEAELADKERILPPLVVGEELAIRSLEPLGHDTQPPARYTEGSLIKELERLGIGRPSTWATVVDVVLQRSYAFKKGQALVPTFLAMAVVGLLERYFTQLTDYTFTASMEDDLDGISRGETDNLKYLKSFYFGNGHPGLKSLVTTGEEKIDPREVCGLPVGTAADGRQIEVRIGRFGPFVSDGTVRASVPDSIAPDELSIEKATQLLVDAAKGPTALGHDPITQKAVYVKNGRFGPYVQLGEQVEGGDKPKMSSLLPGMIPETTTLDVALQLLAMPRSLGTHPETTEEVQAFLGRYGPYVKCGAEARTIPLAQYSPLTITLEQALLLLKEPRRRGRQAGAAAAAPLKEVGEHPDTKARIVVKSGRFGPYVTDGKVNASLPRGTDAATLTVEDAVGLLTARALKMAEEGDTPRRGAKRGGAKKTTEKKAPEKKKRGKKVVKS